MVTLRSACIGVVMFCLWPLAHARGQSAPDRGRAVFQDQGCSHCHTMEGAGGHIGPRLDGVGKRLKKEAIEHQIVSGGASMPPFADALSPDQVHDLVEYLHRSKKDLVTAKDLTPPKDGATPAQQP